MEIPRIAESVELNNLILISIATILLLVIVATSVSLALWLLRRAGRASHIDAVEDAVERMMARTARGIRVGTAATSLLIVLSACGLLAVTVWRGVDVQAWVDETSAQLTWRSALLVVRMLGTVVGVIVVSLFLRRQSQPMLARIEQRLLRVEVLTDQAELVGRLVAQLRPLVNIALVYVAFDLGAGWLALPSGLHWFVGTTIFALLAVNLGRQLGLLIHLMTDALDRLGGQRLESTRYDNYYRGLRTLWPLARRSFEAVTWLAVATLVVGRFSALQDFEPYGPKVIALIGIFFLARVFVEMSRVLVRESLTHGTGAATDDDAAKRRITLVYLVQSGVKYLIYFGAAIWMLRTIGIDPAPFLAGAGIIGLTVGLGAQRLVNDMVSGFFILFEGQMLTGDHVRIGNAEGTVEHVFLRVTKLRDLDGRLHTIRNGNVDTVINFSKDWVFAVVEVQVAYEMNLNEVFRVLGLSGKALRDEAPDEVLELPTIQGVESFDDSGITIRTVTRAKPGTHLRIERLYRKIIKEFFEAHDIEIPYPRQVEIHLDADGERIAAR